MRNCLEFFGEFLEYFLEELFGGTFWEELLGRNLLGEIFLEAFFWEKFKEEFLGGIILEELLGRKFLNN